MSDAPETIWAYTFDLQQDDKSWDADLTAWCSIDPSPIIATKYRRADLPPTLSAAMKLPEVRALVEALRECEAEIDQHIWQEYPADHPVHERYRQRDFGANPARIALAQLKEPNP